MCCCACIILLSLLTAPAHTPTLVDSSGDSAAEPLVLRNRLEKTIFNFDVLDLQLQVSGEAAVRARRWMSSAAWSDALADSIAHTLAHATEAKTEITFLRNVGLKRFLKGIDKSMVKTVRIGWLAQSASESISRHLPDSYAFLRFQGIRDGDRLFYSVQGDSLRVRYLDRDGRECLDEIDVGPGRRIALLGSYFAPGSSLRKGLMRSAREQQALQ
jgi:hypothetical protein